MSEVPDFRLEHSELRGDDEFAEFDDHDLPYYSDWRGSFEKLPWATTTSRSRAAARRRRDRRRAARRRRVSPRPGRASARVRSGWRRPRGAASPLVDPARRRSRTPSITVVDAGDAPVVPTRLERGLRVIHEKVLRVARPGPIPIVLGGDHSITYPSAAAVARHRGLATVGIVHFDAHADTGADQWGSLVRPRRPDAPADRGGMGRRAATSCRSGCAATGRSRRRSTGCASAGPPLAHDGRDRGAGRRGRDRRRDRRGARRPRLHLPVGRHRRRRPGDGAGHRHARVGRHAARASCCAPCARSSGQVDLVGMDVVEVSPPYDHAEVTADPRASLRDGGDQRPRRDARERL